MSSSPDALIKKWYLSKSVLWLETQTPGSSAHGSKVRVSVDMMPDEFHVEPLDGQFPDVFRVVKFEVSADGEVVTGESTSGKRFWLSEWQD